MGLCLLVCIGSRSAQAQDDGVINREHTLKALFLYNFGSYIDWPEGDLAGADQPFVIGILGSSPVESTLHEIAAARTIHGRRIVVERFASAAAVKPCQILFIARDTSPQTREQAVAALRGQQVLIVGETPGFARQGGVANFYIESNKIRFEINMDAAKRHHLKISAKLLALAKIVDGNNADGS